MAETNISFRIENIETKQETKFSKSHKSYLDISPQYHSASCNEPLAASFMPFPFTGVMGFAGFGGSAAEEKRAKMKNLIFLSSTWGTNHCILLQCDNTQSIPLNTFVLPREYKIELKSQKYKNSITLHPKHIQAIPQKSQ